MSSLASIPTKQKALKIIEKGAPFTIVETDVPQPGADEILVRVEAVGLNPVDAYMQSTGFLIEEYPCIIGCEVAGVVVQLGEGVTSFAVGDRVLHPCRFGDKYGAFQQYAVAAADIAAKIPPNITFDEAAAVPLALDTAGLALYGPPESDHGGERITAPWEHDGRGKYANQPIFVFGGSSTVGQYAIQLAKLSGFSPIITTASLKHTDYLKSIGVTNVVDRYAPLESLADVVESITTEPLRAIYVAIQTKELQNAAYDILAPGGRMKVASPRIEIDESKLVPDKYVSGVFGSAFRPGKRATGAAMYSHLSGYLASGDLKPNNVEVISGGLASIPDALQRFVKSGVSLRKLVVHPQETK